jgi:hypothetical protein
MAASSGSSSSHFDLLHGVDVEEVDLGSDAMPLHTEYKAEKEYYYLHNVLHVTCQPRVHHPPSSTPVDVASMDSVMDPELAVEMVKLLGQELKVVRSQLREVEQVKLVYFFRFITHLLDLPAIGYSF